MSLKTFKVEHSDLFDYAHWAKEFFGNNKCVVSAVEHSSSDHVHFIGYTDMNDADFAATLEELKEAHPKKKKHPTCRPVKKSDKEVTEMGFQYVMKTSAKPEYSQGFSAEDLQELKEKSDDHVHELKHGAKEHCHKRKYSGTPEDVHIAIHSDSFDYNRETGRALRPQFGMDTINIMMHHPDATPAWIAYLKRKTMLK